MKPTTHPIFRGGIGRYDGVPEEVVRAISDWSQVILSKAAEAALAAGLPIDRNGEPADPTKFGVITIDAKRRP